MSPANPRSPFSSSLPPQPPQSFGRQGNSGGLFSRFNNRTSYEFLPLHDSLVRFSLADVSSDVYQFLGIPIPQNEQGEATPENIKPLIDEIEKERALQNKLRDWLTDEWQTFQFTGVVYIYDWQEETRNAVNTRLTAIKREPHYTRSRDAVLTLNILARSRSNLMIPDAAIALDRPFLERVLLSDDTRLLKFTQERHHSEALLIEPPQPITDDDFDFDED